MLRTPQRQYTPRALDTWFGRLAHSWENFFTPVELERARTLYREGGVRALEVADTHVIVHGGRLNDDIYALVDWGDSGVDVRHSIANKSEGRALAAAGMYELEELIADEANPLPFDGADQGVDQAALPASPRERSRKVERAARKLKLSVGLKHGGLFIEGFWVSSGGKEENAFSGGKLVALEREQLIHVTTRAHHYHFTRKGEKGGMLLRDPRAMGSFVGKELPKWEARYSVEVPSEVRLLGQGPVRLELQLKVERSAGGRIRFEWEAKSGRKELGLDDLEGFLRQPTGMRLVPGVGVVQLDTRLSEWMSDWQPLLGRGCEGEVPFYMLFSLQAQGVVPVSASEELAQWKQRVESEEAVKGASLPRFLRPYQRKGVRWLERMCDAECHPLLADEMGLGKTVQMLTLLSRAMGQATESAIIVCPASVVPVWIAEAETFFPELKLEMLRKGTAFPRSKKPVVWVASYTQLRRHKSELEGHRFCYAILDEAQMIKNPDAKVTQACLSIEAKHRLAMTGTPFENRHLDVWTIFRFLMPGLMGSRAGLERRLQEEELQVVGDTLKRQIQPFMLRRRKQEVVKELPEKVEMSLICPLSDRQENEYRRLVELGTKELGQDVKAAVQTRAMSFFSLLTRLRQVCCDPGLLPWMQSDPRQSGKLVVLLDRLTELLEAGHKVVLFSQFVSFLDRIEGVLKEKFPNIPLYSLTGKTRDRMKPVERFQGSDQAGVFLVSLKAGGTGITLHAADYVFLLDPWWNPAVEDQAIDRVHRIGQKRRVFIYRLVTRGTIEEKIDRLKKEKRHLFDQLVSGLDNSIDLAHQFARLSDLIAFDQSEVDEE